MLEKKIKILDGQMTASTLYIFFLIISISLTYNEKLELLNKNTLYTRKQAARIAVLNRILALGLVLYYFYANKELIKLTEANNNDSGGLRTQLVASELSILAAIIVLYVVAKDFDSSTYGVSQISNPEI